MSVFDLDALIASPRCSMLSTTVGLGGCWGGQGPARLPRTQTELMDPVPVGSSVSGVEGNQDGPSLLHETPTFTLLEQNQGHHFILLRIDLIPAISEEGWAAGHIFPLTAPHPC